MTDEKVITELKKKIEELEFDLCKAEARIASNTNRIKELELIIDKLIDN